MSRQDVVAPLHVWSKYGVPSMGTAGDQTSGETITVEQTWPYDPIKACKMMRDPFDSCGAAYNVQPGTGDGDPTIRAEKQRADTQGRYKIIAIEQLNTKPVDVQELALDALDDELEAREVARRTLAGQSSELSEHLLMLRLGQLRSARRFLTSARAPRARTSQRPERVRTVEPVETSQ